MIWQIRCILIWSHVILLWTKRQDMMEYFGLKKGELDLLSGGAPCQAFSYAGKRLGLEDARGTLFYHYATFLQKLQPKMFLFENVEASIAIKIKNRPRNYKSFCNCRGRIWIRGTTSIDLNKPTLPENEYFLSFVTEGIRVAYSKIFSFHS